MHVTSKVGAVQPGGVTSNFTWWSQEDEKSGRWKWVGGMEIPDGDPWAFSQETKREVQLAGSQEGCPEHVLQGLNWNWSQNQGATPRPAYSKPDYNGPCSFTVPQTNSSIKPRAQAKPSLILANREPHGSTERIPEVGSTSAKSSVSTAWMAPAILGTSSPSGPTANQAYV